MEAYVVNVQNSQATTDQQQQAEQVREEVVNAKAKIGQFQLELEAANKQKQRIEERLFPQMEALLKEEEKEEVPKGDIIEWKKKQLRKEIEKERAEENKAGG